MELHCCVLFTLVIICKWGCSVSSVSTLLSIKLGQSAFLFSVQRILSNNFHHDYYLFIVFNCGESQTWWYTKHRKVLPIRRSLWWNIWLQAKVWKNITWTFLNVSIISTLVRKISFRKSKRTPTLQCPFSTISGKTFTISILDLTIVWTYLHWKMMKNGL